MSIRRPASLQGQYTLLIGAAFLTFSLLVGFLVLALLMAPMSRRAADDLAGLMVLSAQTWRELPPATRPDFERELREAHMLALIPGQPEFVEAPHHHGVYLYFLEEALARRLGRPVQLRMEERADGIWSWVAVPVADGWITLGVPHERIRTRPLWALGLVLAAAVLLAALTARWLARRIAAPLADLERAMDTVGRGAEAARVPEAGPREIAALGRHFNRTAAQVQELLTARTVLFAGLSHDLRTPLARIRLALEMFANRRDPAMLARVERDVEAMDQLIGELLAMSRGMGHESAERLDAAALLAELRSSAGAAEVGVSMGDGASWVLAPPQGLRRVLGNLLQNALRHGGKGVVVSVRREPGATVFEVSDHGPGIPEDLLEAMFQPFQRVEGSRSRSTGGSGLGLAIVKQLCQANGWEVSLRNRRDGGLVAVVRLPDPDTACPEGPAERRPKNENRP